MADKKYRFALTSISKPVPRCIGLARRRIGRGGRYDARKIKKKKNLFTAKCNACFTLVTICRVILDRCTPDMDEMWSSLDFTIHDSQRDKADSNETATATTTVKQEW